MSSIGFDVYGGDDRDRGFQIDVVDNPTISHMELACKYPAYTGRPANTVPASALVQLPQGTEVTISCESNKDLEQVVVTQMIGDKLSTFADINLATADDHRHFTTPMMVLNEDTTLLFELHDADGIRTRDPVRLVLAARADDVPVVAMRLRGISTRHYAASPAAGGGRCPRRLWPLAVVVRVSIESIHERESPCDHYRRIIESRFFSIRHCGRADRTRRAKLPRVDRCQRRPPAHASRNQAD